MFFLRALQPIFGSCGSNPHSRPSKPAVRATSRCRCASTRHLRVARSDRDHEEGHRRTGQETRSSANPCATNSVTAFAQGARRRRTSWADAGGSRRGPERVRVGSARCTGRGGRPVAGHARGLPGASEVGRPGCSLRSAHRPTPVPSWQQPSTSSRRRRGCGGRDRAMAPHAGASSNDRTRGQLVQLPGANRWSL